MNQPLSGSCKEKIIITLIIAAYKRHNVHWIEKPIHHNTWNDCYYFDPDLGMHILDYNLTKTENSCHEIAIDEQGKVLGDC